MPTLRYDLIFPWRSIGQARALLAPMLEGEQAVEEQLGHVDFLEEEIPTTPQ